MNHRRYKSYTDTKQAAETNQDCTLDEDMFRIPIRPSALSKLQELHCFDGGKMCHDIINEAYKIIFCRRNTTCMLLQRPAGITSPTYNDIVSRTAVTKLNL